MTFDRFPFFVLSILLIVVIILYYSKKDKQLAMHYINSENTAKGIRAEIKVKIFKQSLAKEYLPQIIVGKRNSN